MARTRSIKPEFWSDEKMASVSREARLTFIGILNLSDDYGAVRGHPAWLKNTIYPYDDIKPAEFKKWLDELEKIHSLLPYEVEGEKYYYIRTFTKHQKINNPSQAKNPPPPVGLLEGYGRATVGLPVETETETETETISCASKKPDACASPKKIFLKRFETFWSAYPKKKSKGQAEKAWMKIKPGEQLLASMIAKIEQAKTSEDWVKEDGKFIPYPATWLNGRGWEDEYPGNGNGKKELPPLSQAEADIVRQIKAGVPEFIMDDVLCQKYVKYL